MTLAKDAEALRAILARRTFKRGDFTLASGKRSRIYFNVKLTMLHPEGAELCARLLVARLAALGADYVAGLEMGAVPLVGAVAAKSWVAGRPMPALFVRKAIKAYGAGLQIEGLDEHGGENLAGKRVVLIDDVATSGGSLVKALNPIRAAGGIVEQAIVILDRQEGAHAMLAEHGVALHALATAAELGVTDEDRAPLA